LIALRNPNNSVDSSNVAVEEYDEAGRGKLKYVMLVVASTPATHHIGILMSAEGRFLQCINCRLTLKFPPGTHYDKVLQGFESHPCGSPVLHKATKG
jgi:hypothetical protein